MGIDLAELDRLKAAATARPWERLKDFLAGSTIQSEGGRILGDLLSECLDSDDDIANCDFIVWLANNADAIRDELVVLRAAYSQLYEDFKCDDLAALKEELRELRADQDAAAKAPAR